MSLLGKYTVTRIVWNADRMRHIMQLYKQMQEQLKEGVLC